MDFLEIRDTDELFLSLVEYLKNEWSILNHNIKSGFEMKVITIRTCAACDEVHITTQEDL